MNWKLDIKPTIIGKLNHSFYPEAFKKKMLWFERRCNTASNKIDNGSDWNTVSEDYDDSKMNEVLEFLGNPNYQESRKYTINPNYKFWQKYHNVSIEDEPYRYYFSDCIT